MGLKRPVCGSLLSIIMAFSLVGCGDSNTTGERIRLLITPVPTPTITPLPLPTVGATTYTVQSGDTLSGIATRFGVTVDAIVRANNIADPNSLSEGQVLTIPARQVEPLPTIPLIGTGEVPTIPLTPVMTGTLTTGPSPTATLPPPDATPPQGPTVTEPSPEIPSTPGPTDSPTPGP
jgi:LysM repeat protein